MSQRIQTVLTPYIKRYLRQALGAHVDEPAAPSVQWLRTRMQAARSLQPIYRGLRIEWDRIPGLRPLECCGTSDTPAR